MRTAAELGITYISREFAEPTHGDVARGYKWQDHICSCEECYMLNSKSQKRRKIRRVQGLTRPRVRTYIARKLIKEQLVARGFSIREIAQEVNYTERQIQEIVKPSPSRNGANKFVRGELMDRLKALEARSRGRKPIGVRANMNLVSSDRARRALEGLWLQSYGCGWVSEEIERRTGRHIQRQTVSRVMHQHHPGIQKDLDAIIAEIARDVGFTTGPTKRVAALAKSRGYKPLLEWDDLT